MSAIFSRFHQIPPPVMARGIAYMDDETIISMTCVCRCTATVYSIFKQEYLKRRATYWMDRLICTKAKYPSQLISLFYRSHRPISKLPELTLDQIDQRGSFLITKEVETEPVMRLTGVTGIILSIGTRHLVEHSQQFGREHERQQELSGVLVVFKSTTWSFSWEAGDKRIEKLYKMRHFSEGHQGPIDQVCPTCPFPLGGNVHSTVLTSLLMGTDRLFQLQKIAFSEKSEL